MRRIWQGLKAVRRLLLAHAASRRPLSAPADISASRLVALGSDTVRLDVLTAGAGGLRYLNLHENESTSVRAARALLAHTPGQLIALRAGGQRVVAFRDGARPYAFDPNRIFTEDGMRRTLQFHASDTPRARAATTALRDAVLDLLQGRPDEPVVALHNNRGGDYDARSYRPGAEMAADAQELRLVPGQAPEDFFLTTRRELFEPLHRAGFNAVLQSDLPADDGSLSILFQHAARAYVNVEAHFAHFDQQSRMLAAVAAAFSPAESAL